MAETHEEVVKVWIAPGCIVCDACETDCPEVFEVQEETCIIRPEAASSDFTKKLTPTIKIAAEGCPVDVIKFETIEVDGPDPWEGQEQEAALVGAGPGGGVGPAGASVAAIPEGPPEPKWAGLLANAQIAYRGRGEDISTPRAARVPAEAVAAAMASDAPPDAQAAVMVGSGFVGSHVSVADRIRDRAEGMTRRDVGMVAGVSAVLLLAWASLAASLGTYLAAFQAFFVPRVTKEPASIFRAGRPSDFPDPGVYTQHKATQGVWIIRLPGGRLAALSTTCTHLGCIPNWLSNDQKFKCPCHGSGFKMTGVNFEGPAPRPLERVKVYRQGEFVMIDKSKRYRQELGQWESRDSYIEV